MLRCLDRQATFTFEPPSQDDVPSEQRFRLHCRFISCEERLRVQRMRRDMFAKTTDAEGVERYPEEEARFGMLEAIFRTVVVRADNPPGGEPDPAVAVMKAGDEIELLRWVASIGDSQMASSAERGKSPSQRPTAAESSAGSAVHAGA